MSCTRMLLSIRNVGMLLPRLAMNSTTSCSRKASISWRKLIFLPRLPKQKRRWLTIDWLIAVVIISMLLPRYCTLCVCRVMILPVQAVIAGTLGILSLCHVMLIALHRSMWRSSLGMMANLSTGIMQPRRPIRTRLLSQTQPWYIIRMEALP